MQLAGDAYNTLCASDLIFGSSDFYSLLINQMITDSFNIQPENVMRKLRECLPLYSQKLQDSCHTNVHSLKIAEDIAKNIGFYDIHGSKREDETRLIFESALVLILYIGIRRNIYHRPAIQFYHEYKDFHDDYGNDIPGFDDAAIDTTERIKLVLFSNFMKTVLSLVPNPKGKRAHLLDIVTRLSEGKHKKYITGSGQSNATLRRVQIYQKESGIQPTARPPRIKDMVGILLDENISGEQLNNHMVEYLDDNRPTQNLEVAMYTFNHPTQAGVQVEALEMKTANGMNLLRSFSLLRENSTDQAMYEISRSVSFAAVLEPSSSHHASFSSHTSSHVSSNIDRSCTMNSNIDFLHNLDEILTQPLPAGLARTDQTIHEFGGIVREVSFTRQFANASIHDHHDNHLDTSSQIEPDYYSWIQQLQLNDTERQQHHHSMNPSTKNQSADHSRLRSISQLLNFKDDHDDSLSRPLLSFAKGLSMRSISFMAAPDDFVSSLFQPSAASSSHIPLLEVPADGKSSSSQVDEVESIVRPSKIQRKDWDSLLDFD